MEELFLELFDSFFLDAFVLFLLVFFADLWVGRLEDLRSSFVFFEDLFCFFFFDRLFLLFVDRLLLLLLLFWDCLLLFLL